jgi:[acyl-carrier-protein] S-malonyltransferase
MMSPAVIVCPGQGAQAVGMGRAWHETSAAARETFAIADEILRDRLPAPLPRICFDGPAEQLNRTDISQPAIYVCSVACHRALVERGDLPTIAGHCSTGSLRTTHFEHRRGASASHTSHSSETIAVQSSRGDDASAILGLAGLSLGEYTALHLAGAFEFEDGLRLVAERGRLMQQAAETSHGGMVALIGADENQAEAVCREAAGSTDVLVCANFNAPGQIVLSGGSDACRRAVEIALRDGFRATALAVAGAFHSPLMKPAADGLALALADTAIRVPEAPVWSNVTGLPHQPENAELLRQRLVEQLVKPVRWAQLCLDMAQRASMTSVVCDWHELAPGSVLKGLMRRIDRNVKVISHDEP